VKDLLHTKFVFSLRVTSAGEDRPPAGLSAFSHVMIVVVIVVMIIVMVVVVVIVMVVMVLLGDCRERRQAKCGAEC
jgi:Flp pilus assembly protein TadB